MQPDALSGPGKHSSRPGSDSGNATLPDGGSAAESSSPEPSSPSDAAIDILSSAGAPNDMLGPPCPRTPQACPETPDGATRWRSERPAETQLDGEALTVILKSP